MRQVAPTIVAVLLVVIAAQSSAFAPLASVPRARAVGVGSRRAMAFASAVRMAPENEGGPATTSTPLADENTEEKEELPMDEATRIQLEKQRRADELRAQEVFMKKSTGRHRCTNCDFEYDQAKGDSYLIGGLVKPGTPFSELPSNWRCPTCRASKDSFEEIVEEIPGFEVNQGYGFGFNSMTGGQKTGIIFGGLAFFFVLFLSGYAMS